MLALDIWISTNASKTGLPNVAWFAVLPVKPSARYALGERTYRLIKRAYPQ
jgi:hypothetical protein